MLERISFNMFDRDYKVKIVNLKNSTDGARKDFVIETFHESVKLEQVKYFLLKNIDQIIEKNWGKFGKDFILRHVMKANRLKIVRYNNEIVGLASASAVIFKNKQALYLEFTVVNELYQGYNLSVLLNGEFITDEYLKGLFSRYFTPLDVVTITRNMRVVASLTEYASYIYPDPRFFKKYGKLKESNNYTWKLINHILASSWNPKRKLDREGSVLHGSYQDSPWLILAKFPRHHNRAAYEMTEKYLDLKSMADKEFIVHAQFGLFSILKFAKKVLLK